MSLLMTQVVNGDSQQDGWKHRLEGESKDIISRTWREKKEERFYHRCFLVHVLRDSHSTEEMSCLVHCHTNDESNTENCKGWKLTNQRERERERERERIVKCSYGRCQCWLTFSSLEMFRSREIGVMTKSTITTLMNLESRSKVGGSSSWRR